MPKNTDTTRQVPLAGRGYLAVVDAPEVAEPSDGFLGGLPYPGSKLTRYAWCLDQGIDDPDALLVLLVLVHHDRPDGTGIFPSYDRIQAFTTFRRSRIAKALGHLERHGWIERERDHTGGRRRANRYRIRTPEDGALVRQADLGLVRQADCKG